MPEACKICGYESPETDKFCRQCGGQTEFTSTATTFNRAKMEQNPPGVGTGRLSPSIGDAIAGDTERYYYPPQYAQSPPSIERVPAYGPLRPEARPRSKTFSRLMKGMATFLLFGGLLVTTAFAVFFSQEANRQRELLNELERKTNGKAGGNNANGRAHNAWEQMEDALKLIDEAEESASAAGAELVINGEKPVDLDKYSLPNSQVEAKVISHGSEALSLLTHQDFEAVQTFYERLFGKPVLQMSVQGWNKTKKKLLFQSANQPSILVKIEEVEQIDGSNRTQVKISILHTFLRFPRFSEQARNLK